MLGMSMMLAWRYAALLMFLVLLTAPALAQERRVALVIGIDAYGGNRAGEMPPLRNAVADARALRGALRSLGFQIIGTDAQTENVTRNQLLAMLSRFSEEAQGAAVAMISFHGHGLAVEGRESLLLPRDFPVMALPNPLHRRGAALTVDELSGVLNRTGAPRKILIADACRKELDTLPSEAITRSSGLTRGLGPVEPAAPGLMVIYAAEARQVAYDRLHENDTNPNGVFMRYFLPQLRTPGLSLIQAVERTELQVTAATQRLQDGPQHVGYRVRGGQFSDLILAGSASGSALVRPAPEPQPQGSGYPVAVEQSFRDCTDCPEMMVIPAGSFWMGSPRYEEWHSSHEGPFRQMTLRALLAVGRFEVTFAEWDACVAAGGCSHRPDDRGWRRGNRPVINVSWDDAQQYVRWLSQRTGRTYRLLTEAEWEYAARAGTVTSYALGETFGPSQANYWGNLWERVGRTQPVGSYPANKFGLHEMYGNVWEWVQDCYVARYPQGPGDASVPVTTGDCSHRVVRGGGWASLSIALRAAHRFRNAPGFRDYDGGFRVARMPGG